ncbi:unnamed protein product [Arctogadus glacialis]
MWKFRVLSLGVHSPITHLTHHTPQPITHLTHYTPHLADCTVGNSVDSMGAPSVGELHLSSINPLAPDAASRNMAPPAGSCVAQH